jgi:signal transduction histidine kinase
MRAIGSPRLNALDYAWLAFVAASVTAMILWPRWETIPFHLIWLSLTLLYGVRVWRLGQTFLVLALFGVVSGGLILTDAFRGMQEWGELFEVPLMSSMFLAMVWHARRRQDAIHALEVEADEKAGLLARQEEFLHDVSHELRTPVTIAQGHLEQLLRTGMPRPEVAVALDELGRMGRIVDQLLLLANARQPKGDDAVTELDLERFIEDVVMRWAEVAPRVWRVGELATGTLRAAPDGLRIALDALVENAVNHTEVQDVIEVRSRADRREVVIEVADEGCGVPPAALEEIFDRFGRGDDARSHPASGTGLGLAIVDAIVDAHGGHCEVSSSPKGSEFRIVLPAVRPAAGDGEQGRLAKQATHAPGPPAQGALTRG